VLDPNQLNINAVNLPVVHNIHFTHFSPDFKGFKEPIKTTRYSSKKRGAAGTGTIMLLLKQNARCGRSSVR
jgi:hypothetical protein